MTIDVQTTADRVVNEIIADIKTRAGFGADFQRALNGGEVARRWRAITLNAMRDKSQAAEVVRTVVIATAEARREFVTLDDGYVHFWPSHRACTLAPHELRILADEIDRRNAERKG